MQTEQSGDTNPKASDAQQLQTRKNKRRPKKPKSASTTTVNKETLSTGNEGIVGNAIDASVKKKRKRKNNKKNSTAVGEKTENLISRTFKASKLQSSSSEESKEPSLKDLPAHCIANSISTQLSSSKGTKVFGGSPSCNPLLDAIVKVGQEENPIKNNKKKHIGTPRLSNSSGEQKNSAQKKSFPENKCPTRSATNSNKSNSSCEPQSNVDPTSELSNKPNRSKPKRNNRNKGQAANLNKTNPAQIISSTEDIKKQNQELKIEENKIKTNPSIALEVANNNEVIAKNKSIEISSMETVQTDKPRHEVLAARGAKKLAKQQAKKVVKSDVNTTSAKKDLPTHIGDTNTGAVKNDSTSSTTNETNANKTKLESVNGPQKAIGVSDQNAEKSREEILAEREARKIAKLAAKNKNKNKTEEETKIINKTNAEGEEKKVSAIPSTKESNIEKIENVDNLANNLQHMQIKESEGQKKKPTTKAERRAIQEAQREAKAKLLGDKQSQKAVTTTTKGDIQKKEIQTKPITGDSRKIEKPTITSPSKPRPFKVKFFNQLEAKLEEQNLFVNSQQIHPVMVRLGEQYAKRIVVGSNARCIAFLNALKTVIQDYETPPKKEFSRGLEASIKNCVDHLQKCRPLAVSVSNAYKYIKVVLTKLPPNQPESDLKKHLVELIDIYIKDQIEKAAQAISYNVQESISNGDVILTYGCSSLITHILEEAHRRQIDFRVIVVDSNPFLEGQELLRRLVSKGISCTCVLINAIGFVMPEVTKVLLGAHALLANGYVVSRIGTAQVALVARSFNVSVFVCCEKHKFCERTQTDAIVYNELGNPNDLISKTKDCRLMDWKSFPSLYPLNLNYDVTPPELVNVVVTEVTLMPSTSAPVILRIRPNEMLS